MKKTLLAAFLMFGITASAQQLPTPSRHEPTVAELKLQVAKLKQQLIQAENQILNFQMTQAKVEERDALDAVSKEQAANAAAAEKANDPK